MKKSNEEGTTCSGGVDYAGTRLKRKGGHLDGEAVVVWEGASGSGRWAGEGRSEKKSSGWRV